MGDNSGGDSGGCDGDKMKKVHSKHTLVVGLTEL